MNMARSRLRARSQRTRQQLSVDHLVWVFTRSSTWVQVGVDAACWMVGLLLATWLRFEFVWHQVALAQVVRIAVLAVVLQVMLGGVMGLYVGRWRYGSFEEAAAISRTVLITTAVVAVIDRLPAHHPLPVGATIAGGVVALVLMAFCRYCWRFTFERRLRPDADVAAHVVVIGAGEGGVQVLTAMLRNPESTYVPVALLDDDRDKRSLRIHGVPVRGTRADLARVAAETDATGVVVAVPSATARLIREVSAQADELGLWVKVLPRVSELFGGHVGVADLRTITEADLLGRHEVQTDLDEIAGYLTGRRVLVTGAGGSIGSELCRQIYRFAPAELIMLDRDESALHGVQLSIEGKALLDTPNLVVADIRDAARIDRVFAEQAPDVVFHAAALKHLPLLELHPSEALKTNVLGTENLLHAAARQGVGRFVNVSTDKAADPCSILGYSKRVAERLTAAVAQQTAGTYLSVRFGNVLGSRGSVLTAFRAQIEAGGPLTVTHPDITRYFMTVEEAVQLVIQAGAVGRDGEALVLDMGEPVRIDDVARRLIDQADRPIEVVYTGIRDGEKLHEVLLGVDEEDQRPRHPLISHVQVPALQVEGLQAVADAPDDQVVERLRAWCRVDRHQVTLDD